MHREQYLLNRHPVTQGARIIFLILTVIASVARAAGPGLPSTGAQETWYLYRIAEKDVGHIHETMRRDGDRITTTVEMLVIINRLGSKVEIKGKGVFVETVEGQLRSIRSEMSTSRQTTTVEGSVDKGAIRLLTSTGGKEYRRELPYSGALLGPWGIRQRTVNELKQEGDLVTCQTFAPEVERLAKVARKVLDTNTTLPIPGAKSAYAKVEERLEGISGVRTVWLDAKGRMVRQTESGPFGMTEIILTDRAAALRAGGGTLPEEMYDRTLVRSNVRLPGPRSLERLVVRLRQKDAGIEWPDFDGPGQTILRRDGKELLLEVRQVKVARSDNRPVKVDAGLREYLAPNAVIQSDDAEVCRIAREVVGDEADAFRAACRLRDWARGSMKLDLGIALAPASEVIRQRKGTCVAYAVALASLTRAAGVPSRVAMGHVYVSGIWGGHAWVEVWTGRQWVPIDAAIPSSGPADAARIACVRTSLAEGPGPLLDSLGRLFGNIEVGVVEYEAGSICTKVPEGARAVTIEGDIYRSPWLGLEVRKPAGFRFTKIEAVYPDSTVVAIEGPAGQRVEVRQEDAEPRGDGEEAGAAALRRLGLSGKAAREDIAGRTVLIVDGGGKAGLAFARGPDLWVLTAEGEHAGELLRRVAAQVTVRRQGK